MTPGWSGNRNYCLPPTGSVLITRTPYPVNPDKVTIVARDGLQRLFAAMDGHPASAPVMEHACRSLDSLSECADGKTAMLSAGVVDRLLA